MLTLHCLWAKSNNRTCCQFECDVPWFCFCVDFVRLKLDVQRQGGGKISEVDGQGVGVLKIRQI